MWIIDSNQSLKQETNLGPNGFSSLNYRGASASFKQLRIRCIGFHLCIENVRESTEAKNCNHYEKKKKKDKMSESKQQKMHSQKSSVLPFRIKFTSTVTPLNLGERSHEKTSVKHKSACSARPSYWFIERNSSHICGRDFMDKIIIRPSACTAVHVNLLHEPVLAYHPDGKRVATSSRICWAPWEGPGGSDMPSLFSHTCLKIP